MAVLGVGSFEGERQDERESHLLKTTRDALAGALYIVRTLPMRGVSLKPDEACCVCGRVFPRGSIEITSKDHSGPTASCRG